MVMQQSAWKLVMHMWYEYVADTNIDTLEAILCFHLQRWLCKSGGGRRGMELLEI